MGFRNSGMSCRYKQNRQGKLIPLSMQQVVDCSLKSCNTYDLDSAFDYIEKNGSIDTESDYPYKDNYTKCDTAKVIPITLLGINFNVSHLFSFFYFLGK